jgi:hypothetical protein
LATVTLATAADVIRRANIDQLPQYEDVGPISDAAGFFAYRPYPPGSELSKVVTGDGRHAVRCLIKFYVDPPTEGSFASRVVLQTRLSRRWKPGRIWSSTGDEDAHDSNDPDAPTPESATIFQKAHRPLDINFRDEYTYNHQEDVFIGEQGSIVTPEQMLEDVYTKHCRTLAWWFRVRWKVDSAIKFVIRHAVWRGQDVAMWLLLKFYDVEPEDRKLKSPFHRYKPSEFRRVTEKPEGRSHFFGFQTSQKSLFTNLAVVAAACALVFWIGPHGGFIRAIYNNDALTTAALVFGFLFADLLGPWLLIRVICLLSQVRGAALFLGRKVRV